MILNTYVYRLLRFGVYTVRVESNTAIDETIGKDTENEHREKRIHR